ncbi:MAG: GNAT family N-acetyltransferase [Spirochaetales bacterium]|nr:GNAT family N-acetyltransferase [Spirochaetales bacterium]
MSTENFLLLKVVLSSNDGVIGHCQFKRIDREKSRASIGRILINPEKRGHGYGLQLINEMKNYTKLNLKLKKLDLRVFDFNHPAIGCYRKAGFIEIGINDNHIPEFKENWRSLSMECIP